MQLSVVSAVFINSERQRVPESLLDLGAEIFQLISCFDRKDKLLQA